MIDRIDHPHLFQCLWLRLGRYQVFIQIA